MMSFRLLLVGGEVGKYTCSGGKGENSKRSSVNGPKCSGRLESAQSVTVLPQDTSGTVKASRTFQGFPGTRTTKIDLRIEDDMMMLIYRM